MNAPGSDGDGYKGSWSLNSMRSLIKAARRSENSASPNPLSKQRTRPRRSLWILVPAITLPPSSRELSATLCAPEFQARPGAASWYCLVSRVHRTCFDKRLADALRGQNARNLLSRRHSAVHSSLQTPFARRTFHGLCCLISLALGLASRRYTSLLGPLFGKYPGDALWATMVFFGIGLMRPMSSVRRLAVAASVFSCGIELLKLCSTPWLVQLRATRFGYLVFGHVFSFENLAAYAVGITLGSCVASACLKPIGDRGSIRAD